MPRNDELAALLIEKQDIICDRTFARRLALNPEFEKRYQGVNKAKFYSDCRYHLDYLSIALAYDSPVLFSDYLLWVKQLFNHLPISQASLTAFFSTFLEVIGDELDHERQYALKQYLSMALSVMNEPISEAASFVNEVNSHSQKATQVLNLLLSGDRAEAYKYVQNLVAGGMSIRDCYLNIIQPIQYEVGRLWHTGEISVGQEHYVTAASQMIMAQFYPVIFNHPNTGKRMIAACISGEQHEVGLRMVSDLMELEGWDTMFLGANTPIETIPQAAISRNADLLAVSVTISTHLNKLKQLITVCRNEVPQLKIMVGGYPFNLDKELWHKLGADAYANDATSAIRVAESLVS